MKPVLTANDVRAYYRLVGDKEVRAVDGIDFELQDGEVVGLAGESGCGKSTLAAVLALTATSPLYVKSGEIWMGDKDVLKMNKDAVRKDIRGRYVSVVPQGAMNALNPTVRIKKLAFDILRAHDPNIRFKEAVRQTGERLESVSLPTMVLDAYPHQLSGGMKQRTVIALSTLLNPKILICDEPTSALDVSSQKVVIQMLMKLLREEVIRSIIFVTHELPLLRHFTNRIGVMYAGKMVEIGAMENIIFHPQHPYSSALMDSMLVPEDRMRDKELTGIPGVPPDLKNPPEGCRFHPRCPHAMDICRDKEPPMEAMAERSVACWLLQKQAGNL